MRPPGTAIPNGKNGPDRLKATDVSLVSTTPDIVNAPEPGTAVLDPDPRPARRRSETGDSMPDASAPDPEVNESHPEHSGENSVDAETHSLAIRIEAILISTDRQTTEARLAEVLGLSGKGTKATITKAVKELNDAYEHHGRAFRIERLAGGLQILTLPAFGPLLASMHAERQSSKLSQAALETLAIISYRQPIMRAEIEAIRGVACGEVLRGLIDRRMVKIVGRAEELGRPMLYGTTKQFLEIFGLASLDDLPNVEGLNPTANHSTPSKPRTQSKPESTPTDAGPIESNNSSVESGDDSDASQCDTEE